MLLAWVLVLLGVGISGGAEASLATVPTVALVVGAPGDAELGSNFLHQAQLWQAGAGKAGAHCFAIGVETNAASSDYDALKQLLSGEAKDGPAPLWLVLLGHGTFDGKEAKFNMRGPDVSATELADWLRPFHRPLVVIDTSSCSAPVINKLSGTNRVIVTATRSGHEQNFARFGQYFADAITNDKADLDKDGQVSVLEAFLIASRDVAEFYKTESRLATEHALLDDNGDGLGIPADWFRGVRAVKKPKENTSVDGVLAGQFVLVPSRTDALLSAEQRVQRDALERAVFLHREKKSQMAEEQYYDELEKLLLQLAKFYQTNGPATRNESNAPGT